MNNRKIKPTLFPAPDSNNTKQPRTPSPIPPRWHVHMTLDLIDITTHRIDHYEIDLDEKQSPQFKK